MGSPVEQLRGADLGWLARLLRNPLNGESIAPTTSDPWLLQNFTPTPCLNHSIGA